MVAVVPAVPGVAPFTWMSFACSSPWSRVYGPLVPLVLQTSLPCAPPRPGRYSEVLPDFGTKSLETKLGIGADQVAGEDTMVIRLY